MTHHVLVPMDESPLAERALEHALTVHEDADITVLYVRDDVAGSYPAHALVGRETLRERVEARTDELFAEADALAAEHGVDIETATATGDPAREIVRYAGEHDVDQVVIGSHGRPPLSRILLGSVAEPVVRRAPVPVTVVR